MNYASRQQAEYLVSLIEESRRRKSMSIDKAWTPSEGQRRADDVVTRLIADAHTSGLNVFSPVFRNRMVELIAAAIDDALTQHTIAPLREAQTTTPVIGSERITDWLISGKRAGLPSASTAPVALNGGGAAQEPIVPPPAKAARKAKRSRGRPKGSTKAAKEAALKATEDTAKAT